MRKILLCLILFFVSFVIVVPKVNATEDYVLCEYRHPNYKDCRLALWKEKGSSKWTFINQSYQSDRNNVNDVADEIFGTVDNTKCATVDGEDIRTIVPNAKHNENFYKEFNNSYKNNKVCPDIYIGKKYIIVIELIR